MPEQHTLLLIRGQLASINMVRANGRRRLRSVPALAKGVAIGLFGGVGNEIGSGGGDGLCLFKRGNCIKKDPVKVNGLYLRSHHSGNGLKDDGLFIKRGGFLESVGNRLILGKNFPFKNFPILG